MLTTNTMKPKQLMTRLLSLGVSLAILGGQMLIAVPTAYGADSGAAADPLAPDELAAQLNNSAPDAADAAASVPSGMSAIAEAKRKYSLAQAPGTAAVAPSGQGLTVGAREAAKLLGILPQVERLMEIKRMRGGQRTGELTDEELALKVDVFDKVLGASLEINMVGGRIDRELAWAYGGLGMLTGKKQRLINDIVTANFMQIGILGVISGPLFLHEQPKQGTELLLIDSAVGLTLSTVALLVNKTQGRKVVDGGATVLADVFHLQQPPANHRADVVVAYMNSVPPGSASSETRIQGLMSTWKKGHYLPASASEQQLQKLAAVQPPDKKLHENIRILQSRIRMLFDTKYTIEMLHADLLDLLRVTDLG